VDEVSDDETDDRLEDHRRYGEQAGLVDDQPEGVAAEQELEIPEADEAGHALVERREVDRVTRRIGDQDRDQEDQRQGHQEGDGRLALHELVKTAALLRRMPGRISGGDVCHRVLQTLSGHAGNAR
jgi:hypothetical protein